MEVCADWYRIFQYICIFACFVMLMISIGFSCKVVKHIKYHHHRNPLKCSLYLLNYLFIFTSLVLYLILIGKALSEIYSSFFSMRYYLFMAWGLFYYLQWYLLILLLFVRLYSVFKDDFAHSLSRTVIIVYSIMFTMLFVVLIVSIITILLLHMFVHYLLVGFVFIYFIVLSVSIMYLFIYKLFRIYKLSDTTRSISPNNHALRIIFASMTKNTILTALCIGISLLTVLNYAICLLWIDGKHPCIGRALSDFWYLLDSCSNFVCIMLTFAVNKTCYLCLCGCVEGPCKRLCIAIARHSNKKSTRTEETNELEKDDEDVINIADEQVIEMKQIGELAPNDATKPEGMTQTQSITLSLTQHNI